MTQTAAIRMQTRSDLIDYTPASTAVNPGDIVLVGSIPLAATSAIAVGVQGALAADGIFNVPKDTSTFSAGDPVYWNATGNPVLGTSGTGCATSTSAGNNFMGYATTAQLTGDNYVSTALCAFREAASLTTFTTLTGATVNANSSTLALNGQAGSSSAGGAITLTGGAGNGTTNAGGAINLVGGQGAVTGAGAAVNITAGAGGATSGTGGALVFSAGAGTNGNAAGGAGSTTGGAGQGTGSGGAMSMVGGSSGAGATGNGGLSKIVGGAATSTNGTGGAGQVTGGVGTGTGAGGAVTITSGASGGASGTSGQVTIDVGSKAGGTSSQVIIGDVNANATYINRGPLVPPIIGQTIAGLGTTQNSTPTAAQLLGGIVTQTGATGAGTFTLPTGTTLSAACARVPVAGDSFLCWFINVGGGQTITITGATGTTVSGTVAVPSAKFALMQFINTGSNTWNIYVLVSA